MSTQKSTGSRGALIIGLSFWEFSLEINFKPEKTKQNNSRFKQVRVSATQGPGLLKPTDHSNPVSLEAFYSQGKGVGGGLELHWGLPLCQHREVSPQLLPDTPGRSGYQPLPLS